MNIAVCYIYPTSNYGTKHAELAARFVKTYLENPPNEKHTMVVVSNGGPPSEVAVGHFSPIPGTKFIEHDDSGMDIGGYQLAAKTVPCDLMVFFGGSTYLRKPGWLKRIAESYTLHGDALYGCMGHQGCLPAVWPHVRTTAFWCSPKLINDHPMRVSDNAMRYAYEHGQEGLTSWAISTGRKVFIVGMEDIKELHECDSMRGRYHEGNQHNLIVGDRISEPPYWNCA
jgi:hypothetical protein